MRLAVLWTLPIWLALSGCGLTLGPQAIRETTWAKMGTPGRIVEKREVEVLVPDGAGGWTRSRAVLAGMVTLDEPTYELFLKTYEERQSGREGEK